MQESSNLRSQLLVALAIAVTVVLIYAPVRSYDFVSWDDPLYVRDNLEVSQGLTWHGALWAFTTGHSANWHPLTWLSHMLDVEFFGASPGPQHVTNVLIHIINSLLLFGVLRRLTGNIGASAFVAALFAVHPMHVESVAWVSERKDVLSTMFALLTIWEYTGYVRRPGAGRYLAVVALFAFALMSKPMVVTLPFVLLLLDVWPLQRVRLERGQSRVWARLAREKLPLIALSVVASIVTIVVQARGGTVVSLETFPFSVRAANAPVSYVAYLLSMVWPAGLAPFYPYPPLQVWVVIGSVLILAAVSFVIARAAPRRPYLLIGWLWYLGMLAPVIGVIQVGEQSRADRYSYLPLVGIFIIAAWGIPELLGRRQAHRVALATAAMATVFAYAAAAHAQVRHWENSLTLWEHTTAVTTGNYIAHTNLGLELAQRGEASAAIEHFNEAIRSKPNFAEAHNALGVSLLHEGRAQEAVTEYMQAIAIKPSYAEPHSNMAMVLSAQGRVGEGIVEFLEAVKFDPGNAQIHYNLGFAFAAQQRFNEAIDQYTQALRLNPSLAEAQSKWGDALLQQDRFTEAEEHYRRAIQINPGLMEPHNNLAVGLMDHGREDEAIEHFNEAIRINPGFADAHNNLGILLAHRGKNDEAAAQFKEALRIRPDYKQAESNLAIVLSGASAAR